jgi:hypothetical protein
LSVRLDSDLRDALSEAVAAALAQANAQAVAELNRACDDARRSQVESLNQVLRRLRTTGREHILDLVAEGCASYARQVVVLVFESNQARTAASCGISNLDGALCFDTSTAPAIVAAVESLDPVVALSTAGEISPVLAGAFHSPPGENAYLFPIVARHSVVAMLVASGVTASAPVELLCEAAGMKFEASTPPETASVKPQPRAWDDLAVEDQRLHVQAQRMARLRVAEMRLYRENELKSGTAGSDLYGALRNEIDAARDQFLQTFLSKSSTMVDYLHLEILRSLAHDDDRLLGHQYPGPMV